MFHGDRAFLEKPFCSMARGEHWWHHASAIPTLRLRRVAAYCVDLGSGEIPEGLNPIGRLKPGVSLQAAAADLQLSRGASRRFIRVSIRRGLPLPRRRSSRASYEGSKPRFTLCLLRSRCCCSLPVRMSRPCCLSVPPRDRKRSLFGLLWGKSCRLTQQFLMEALVLASAGCILGCLLAYGSLKWLVASFQRIGFLTGLCFISTWQYSLCRGNQLVTTLVCGFVPALHAVGLTCGRP